MSSLSVIEYHGTFVVDSRLIAQELGIEHRAFMQTLKRYQTRIEEKFGVITFEMFKPLEGSLGGRPEKYALLTEPQATTLMTFSKNTEQVVDCKINLVAAFEKAKSVITQQVDTIRQLELQLQVAQAQAQVFQAEKALIDVRHTITLTCPEPIQQKILGYTEVKVVEYRDRVVDINGGVLSDGDTINKTALCNRYGIKTKNGAPDYKRLNKMLDDLGITNLSEAWKLTAAIKENLEFRTEFLPMLDQKMITTSRQRWLGEV